MRMRSAAVVVLALASPPVTAQTRPEYPDSRRQDLVETLHGVAVADPYRWLEDIDSKETATWVEAQNKVTFGLLGKIPARAALRERLTKLWNFERFGVPLKEGGRYFYTRNDGLQNQAVLLVADALAAEPRVLLDPNTLRADGTVALAAYSPSPDAKLLAYALAEGGSDWNVWKVRDVATGQDLADELAWVKFSDAAWTKDGRGFFYSRFAAPKEGDDLKGANKNQTVWFHAIGTPQSADKLVYERPDKPEWYLYAQTSDDGRWLVITAFDGATDLQALFVKDLATPGASVRALADAMDARYNWVDNDGTVFLVRTDKGAPNGRLIAIDAARPWPNEWKEVVPEAKEALQEASIVGERLFAHYLQDAKSVIRAFDLAGRPLGDVPLPGLGSVGGFGGRRGDAETFYAFTGFTSPTTIYRYDAAAGRSDVFRTPKVDFDPAAYETKQVFYASKDGTKVPMFVVHKKGLVLDGKSPAILYGYGGFNVPLTPAFSVSVIAWLERGGVYASANLRGGSEYGEAWHEAGMRHKKQNVFDDFIAAGEWLVANKYTSPKGLAAMGGSNGGLLVGAVVNQRPDLWGAALPAVGVMDMLRFHTFTVGWGWVGDYGSPDKADEFKTLRAYSPYHNLKPGTCYPPTLITTADHDDRVFPAHSFKYAAALQHAQGCANPVLIRVETRAGHGAGKPVSKAIEEVADEWAFLHHALAMEGGR
ncbi:MAG: prolyl oligopeptidase family serine peptidase [Vicinamibacteria bacterium]|nr:prolyl oligopeptidase family serine peptidase [Vicinamibacteria bacterium]